MTDSAHWDEAHAERYLRFRYEFPQRSLAGKVVVVAGGTGGLGAATVALLAREGAQVVVGYRSNRERAEALGAAIEEQFGRKLTLVEGDLADAGVRQTYLNAFELEGAPLAGAAIFPGDPARVSLESLDEAALEASFAANFVGPVLLARDLGEAMERSNSGGSLVLLGTMQAVAAFPSSLNYAAPKAALVHAAQILAQHWNRVRVNVVAPGATVAGMAEASIRSGKYDRHIESGAIPRFGRPEDVARAVRFFLDPDGYATGQVLVVDGGLTLRRAR
jgi:3-oxoacyl-[acyl-carrier protein] reductase